MGITMQIPSTARFNQRRITIAFWISTEVKAQFCPHAG